jgi:hypothetical protein
VLLNCVPPLFSENLKLRDYLVLTFTRKISEVVFSHKSEKGKKQKTPLGGPSNQISITSNLKGSMQQKFRSFSWGQLAVFTAALAVMIMVLFAPGRMASRALGQGAKDEGGCADGLVVKGQCEIDLLSAGGVAALFGPQDGPDDLGPGNNNGQPGQHDNGRGGNSFVNDPCLDPPPDLGPPSNQRTVQSETEIAVLNGKNSSGKKMIVGYNDSYGFYNRKEGLSGFSYSTEGGNTWIDGGGLPPIVAGTNPAVGDRYFGDPVVVVDNSPRTFTVSNQQVSQPEGVFYYASIYQPSPGLFSLSVNRGRFQAAPPQGIESVANTRCLNRPQEYLVPDPPNNQKERIIWEPPVVAVAPVNPTVNAGALLDKEWLYVDQNTGTLYLTYTRFAGAPTFETPIEMVRSFDGGRTWTAPSVIVANEDFDFNQATQTFTTPTGRVIVTWNRRRFAPTSPFPETEAAIEYAYSDNNGATFTTEQLVTVTNPQGEPPGYNRGRTSILNAPYIIVDRGSDDGVFTSKEVSQRGFGNVYITYFSGKTPASQGPPFLSQADIFVSRSTNNGTSFDSPVKVNEDPGMTSHVFPSVQVDKQGSVFVAWLDRRDDPFNLLTNTWANISQNNGLSYGHDKLQTDVATSWFVRRDAAPNFGDYNSSELLSFNQFVTTWADGRFPKQLAVDPTLISFQRRATPDTMFTIANGLGVGNDPNVLH